MTGIFREKSPASVFWLVMLSIGLHTHFIADPPQMLAQPSDGLLFLALDQLPKVPSVGLMVLYQLLIIFQALRLNYHANDLRMYPRPGYLVAMLYVIITSMLPEWNNVTPALVANTLLIWLMVKLSRLYQPRASQVLIFNCGALAAATALVYQPMLVLLPWSFVVMAILRPFHLREWFILLLGMLTPYYLLVAVLYLLDQHEAIRQLQPWFQWHSHSALPHWPGIVAAGTLLLLLALLGLGFGQANSGRLLIQARKTWGSLVLLLVLCLPLPFVYWRVGLEAGLAGLVPLAVIGTHFVAFVRLRWLAALFCLLLVALSLYTNYTWILVRE